MEEKYWKVDYFWEFLMLFLGRAFCGFSCREPAGKHYGWNPSGKKTIYDKPSFKTLEMIRRTLTGQFQYSNQMLSDLIR
jgi:hypothetical protein